MKMHGVTMSYYRAAPSAWTFTIGPIAALLQKYSVGRGWVDPFAGKSQLAEWRNDINPEMNQPYCLLADDFCTQLPTASDAFEGVLFDPPYSYRQVSECYAKVGLKARSIDTSNNFYNRVMNAICDKIKPGGYAISFGWNTNGFGTHRNFSPVEIMVVAHGQHHNDTLVLVEQKYIYPQAHDA